MENDRSTADKAAAGFPAATQTGTGFELETEKEMPRPETLVVIVRFVMMLGFLSPVYYLLIWRKIPGEDMKLIVTGVVCVAFVLLFILTQWKKSTGFEAAKAIPILVIIFGAILASLICPVELLENIFKVFVVLFFSVLPGGLYLHFIRTKGKTLEDEYVLNLRRLHIDKFANLPELPERAIVGRKESGNRDVQSQSENIYLKKFEALFGPPSNNTLAFATLQDENVWPVAVATLIISVGWILVMKPGGLAKLNAAPAAPTAPSGNDSVDTRGDLRDARSAEKAASGPYLSGSVFDPLCFAFLGAYFYILQMLVRRHFQNDLKAAAYINATMRIVIVVLLVWVVDMLLQRQWHGESIDPPTRKAAAFVIGVFPYVGWQALQTLIRLPFQFVVPVLKRKYPLDDLDGLNIWYESRLLEEGIEDMQNLATANLVDVILNTRIPVDRLVDWVDQSLLYLHLSHKETSWLHRHRRKSQGEDEEDARAKLRRFGIRTATDLDDAFNSHNKELIGKLEYLLNKEKDTEPSILRCIHATFKNEPNLYHVRQWKGFADHELKPETDAFEQAHATQTSALSG